MIKLHEDIISCGEDTSIQDVAKLINEHNVRHVYVTRDQALAGIVGGIDINNKIVAQGKDYRTLTARDIMNECEFVEENNLEKAYAIMRNFNTFLCPVVKEGKLIGYYTFQEVCDALNTQLEGAN